MENLSAALTCPWELLIVSNLAQLTGKDKTYGTCQGVAIISDVKLLTFTAVFKLKYSGNIKRLPLDYHLRRNALKKPRTKKRGLLEHVNAQENQPFVKHNLTF